MVRCNAPNNSNRIVPAAFDYDISGPEAQSVMVVHVGHGKRVERP